MADAKQTGFRSRFDIIENERLLLLAIADINDAHRNSPEHLSHYIRRAVTLADRVVSERPNHSLAKGR